VTCKEVIRRLSEYLDHELDPALEASLVRHLEHCEDCSLVVNTTRKTIDLFCNTEPLPLPQSLEERLKRALTEKLDRKS
jgi:hypothetical protein